ncbi:protein DYAD [Vigna umbellata]|uniref:protein DYAD n=1 Tax=Vigna umbellata TaxID=87088 RepID=UPI001F5EC806|nr:protein DYAD [Vigna umbellata]
MTDLGKLNYFLGLEFIETVSGVVLHQGRYINEVLKRFNMKDYNNVPTPVIANLKLAEQLDEERVDASLCNSKPDISYGVGLLSRFMNEPRTSHMIAAKHILRYLKGTTDFGLLFPKVSRSMEDILEVWSDSDWSGDRVDRRNTFGYFIQYEGAPISRCSKKQIVVALSSCEAEYIASAETACLRVHILLAVHHLSIETLSHTGTVHDAVGACSRGIKIVEQSPCGFVAAGTDEDMRSSHLKRQEKSDAHVDEDRSKKSPCLDKHVLLFPPASESTSAIGAWEHFKVGLFHEIDHTRLSPISPVQLKSVRIVMVSDIGVHLVSLRYPSLQSLRMHFSDQNFGKQDGKTIPALDEKYVMGMDFAIKALSRSIPTEEFAQRRNSWSFWVSPSKENTQDAENPALTDAARSLISKQGSCWTQLKSTGMMQWGKRRQVRFLGRHEEAKVQSLPEPRKGKMASVELREGTSEKKRKKGEEEMEATKEESFGDMRMTRQCRQSHQNVSSSGVKKSKKAKNDPKKQQLVLYNKNKRKISIGRWSAERYIISFSFSFIQMIVLYMMAEENMLKVMKEKRAAYGNPILRPDLRSEARKYIGDTGLLDHLLKHMAGKVAPGGAERFRRRHNAEGAMEYWLESADLVEMRKEAGVQDPYWTPSPGWKLGDSISQDYVTGSELREIKEEILKLKQDMRELAMKKGEEVLAIETTPSSCLSSLNSEDYGSLAPKEEIYAELVSKKAKIEEQLKEISVTLSCMEVM